MNSSDIKYVFLDRDGVLNRKPPAGQYITSANDFELLPGVEKAIARLNRSGRKVVVVTNQRGIARGLFSSEDLAEIHGKLQAQLARHGAHLDAIYVCPHEEGECSCRKPLTGLFERAFADFPGADPECSLMVGDSLRDIEAGVRLGMATVLVAGEGEPVSADSAQAAGMARLCVASLPQFVDRICAGD